MGTVTNYYLLNLSISDLLLLTLGLPYEMYSVWVPAPDVLGESFCRFRLLASETSANVSVLTITSFTVERYLAICHPISRPRRVSHLLGCLGLKLGQIGPEWDKSRTF